MADDTQVYLSFKLGSISSEESAFSAIQSCISAIRSWLLTNKLLINDTKTEFLIIGTRQQIYKVQTDSISVGGRESLLPKKYGILELGSIIPSQCLLRSAKLPPPASTTSITSGVLESISLGEVCETLVNSLITSRLDYCNSLFYGCPSSLLARLQRVQNSAARLIYNVSRTFSSSPLLINLHWLPVKHRILFKILLITYKVIHYLAPDYINQLIQVKSSNRTLRSSNAILLEHPTIKSSKTLGDRAFTLAAPVEWNLLPPNIWNAPSLLL